MQEKIKDDTISRQAAIDAADSETVSTNPDHFKSREKFIKFMDDDDIASFGKWQWANGFNTALVAVTIQLEKLPSAEPEQRWIPCSENLPTKEGHYLCSFKKLNFIDRIHVNLAYWTGGRWYGYLANEINAWMPLPEPYTERRKE